MMSRSVSFCQAALPFGAAPIHPSPTQSTPRERVDNTQKKTFICYIFLNISIHVYKSKNTNMSAYKYIDEKRNF